MAEVRPISDIDQRRSEGKGSALSEVIDISDAIRRAAALDLKECKLSREEVAEALSRRVYRSITRSQIEAYIAESKPHRFPLDLVAEWVRVTGSRRLLELVCAEAGFYCSDEMEQKLAAFGRAALERERVIKREAQLKAELMEKVR